MGMMQKKGGEVGGLVLVFLCLHFSLVLLDHGVVIVSCCSEEGKREVMIRGVQKYPIRLFDRLTLLLVLTNTVLVLK